LREAEILQMHSGGRLTIDETVDPLTDLDRQAAQIASLDLVVSISTTAAHMAGALGVKSFLLLNSRPLWHWGSAQAHCPWYPHAELIRQQRPGDWTVPLMKLRRKLERLAEAA
jgi:ADP-heptose:LPS heptosyltransferase